MSAHHIIQFNGKEFVIDYVQAEREFRTACQRIVDNGVSGEILCPDGKRFEVRQCGRIAGVLRRLNALPNGKL